MKQLFLCCAVVVFLIAGTGLCMMIEAEPGAQDQLDALARGEPLPQSQVSSDDLILLGLLTAICLLFLILYRMWDRPPPKYGEFKSPLK